MGEKAIRHLRTKIIAIMLMAFLAIMVLIAVAVNGAYVNAAQSRMDGILDSIITNDGVLPENARDSLSITARHDVQYFMVVLDSRGNVLDVGLDADADMDRAMAVDLAQQVRGSLFGSGSIGDYYYKVVDAPDGGKAIAFVNGTVELGEGRRVRSMTLVFLGAGLAVAFVLVWFLSRRAIEPEIEAAKRQQEFITNASHELKTPLAVIRANTEVEEALQGESEWSQSTLRQVDYLDGLVKNLVEFARAEEVPADQELAEVDVAQVAAEVVETYQAVTQQRGLTLASTPSSGVTVASSRETVSQLLRLLVDNACKYCDENGSILVKVSPLKRSRVLGFWRRGARIVVSNTYVDGTSIDFNRLFDRFYRGDTSHGNQSGYGIGLSIAQHICEESNGSIKASWKGGVVSFTCVLY